VGIVIVGELDPCDLDRLGSIGDIEHNDGVKVGGGLEQVVSNDGGNAAPVAGK
jgi:hypothetical protein